MRALGRAYEAGVSWFDVAPSYGDGEAEGLLGRFLLGKRSQVVICTKVGMLPCPISLPLRVAKPVLRRAVSLFPALRSKVVKLRPHAQRAELTGSLIESSIVESLQRLRTDHVDVLALHEPSLADVQREDVLRALEYVVRKGYARAISLAGDLRVALPAVTLSERLAVIQVANSPFDRNVELAKQRLPACSGVRFVTHSVYGYHGCLDTLADMISKEPAKRDLMQSAGYRGTPREAAAALLLDFALASNPDGVVLLSMYQKTHFAFNLKRLAASPRPEVSLDLASRLAPPPRFTTTSPSGPW